MEKSADFSRSVIGASDEVIEIYCDPCKKGGNLVSAEGFCVDCSEYLCKPCYNSHRRFKALENHVLQDKDSMPDPAKSTQGNTDVCVEKCSNHPSKVVEFFCGTCDTLGCYACITVNHRQCEKVVHIDPDTVKEPATAVEFTKSDIILGLIAIELNEHKKKIASNTKTNIQMKELAKEVLQKQRNKINKFFYDLEKKMDLEIEHIQNDKITELKAASDKLASMEKEFNEIKTSIDSKRNGQNCELFIAMKKNKQKIETLKEKCNKLSDESIIQKYMYTWQPSEQIEAMMRITTEICRMTTAKFQGKIGISTSKDNGIPYIFGLTTVHGHFCVVTDNVNKSVKVVDARRKCVTSEIGIDAVYLYGLTTVNNDSVAVSVFLPDGRCQIQFFSVSNSGVIKSTAKTFDVESPCWDLDYYNDKLFLTQSEQIQICNITGQVFKTIKHDSAGDAEFRFLWGISLSPDGQTIYVTDSDKNSVISMTLDGIVKAVYKDKDLKEPSGITVDKDGYVYVRNEDTRSIHQLTADLSRGQIIIEDVYGCAINFSSTKNKLYLSDGKCVSVYDVMKR